METGSVLCKYYWENVAPSPHALMIINPLYWSALNRLVFWKAWAVPVSCGRTGVRDPLLSGSEWIRVDLRADGRSCSCGSDGCQQVGEHLNLPQTPSNPKDQNHARDYCPARRGSHLCTFHFISTSAQVKNKKKSKEIFFLIYDEKNICGGNFWVNARDLYSFPDYHSY